MQPQSPYQSQTPGVGFAPVGAVAPYGPPPATESVFGTGFFDALTLAFRGPGGGNRLLLSIVYLIIPIVGQIAIEGYFGEIAQRSTRRHPNPLPKLDFSDFGKLLERGVPAFIVSFLAGLPVGMIVGVFYVGIVIGASVAGAATNEPALVIAVIGVGVLVLFALLAALGVGVSAFQTRAELSESFETAMQFGPVMRYARATFWPQLTRSLLLTLVAPFVVVLGMLLCYVGIFPAIAILRYTAFALRHQVYEKYLAEGGEPLPLKPPQVLPSEAQWQAGYPAR